MNDNRVRIQRATMRGTNNLRTINPNMNHNNNNNNHSNTITLPRGGHDMDEVAGATDTIYLCNFRVSVDGEWLCLKELQNLDIQEGKSGGGSGNGGDESGTVANFGTIANNKCEEITKHERDWATYCRLLLINSFLISLCLRSAIKINFFGFKRSRVEILITISVIYLFRIE